MKKYGFFAYNLIICGLLIFALSGCISPGNTPDPRFYMLKAMSENEITQKLDIPAGIITVIGPVKIPQYLDRPQMVTQNEKRMMNMAQFDRWAEPLDSGIARLIVEDLNLLLPGMNFEMFPANFAIPLNYQVIVGVLQLDGNLKKDLLFVAQWSIVHADTRKLLYTKRSEMTVPVEPHSYAGLADALSKAVASLSTEIAQNLSLLANQPIEKSNGD